MKKNKTPTYLIFIIYPITLFIALRLIKMPGHILLMLYHYIDWIALALCLLLIFSPWGSIPLKSSDDSKPRLDVSSSLGFIIALQLSLLLCFFSLYYFIFHTLPVSQKPVSFYLTLNTLWQKFGLFPWGMVALLSVNFAYISYRLKRNTFFAMTLKPLLNLKDQSSIAMLCQVITRNAIVTNLGITFAFTALAFAVLIASHRTGFLYTGLHNSAFLTAIAILMMSFLPPVQNFMKKLLRRKLPSVFGLMAISFIMGMLLLLLSTLFSTIPDKTTGHQSYHMLHTLQAIGSKNLWLILAANWWFAWVPICAVFIAYVSHGYSIRACILACLITPLILTGLSFLTHQFHWSPRFKPWSIYLLGTIGWVSFLCLITRRSTQGMLVLSYLPKLGAAKYRDHHFFYRRVFQIAAATTYLYLPSGIPYISLMTLLAIAPLALIALLSVLSLLKRLCLKSRVR